MKTATKKTTSTSVKTKSVKVKTIKPTIKTSTSKTFTTTKTAKIKATAPVAAKVVKTKTTKLPDWEVMLNVLSPTIKRPRRTSLHTLAAVLGRKDPLKLAKEMEKSGKVVGYVCPDVKTPIFYLKSLAKHPGMIDTRSSRVWAGLAKFFVKHPFPAVQGFKRFAAPTWSGGSYGVGKYVAGKSAMDVPYEKGDYRYANEVIKALKKAGYTPGIKPFKIAKGFISSF